MAGDAGDMPLLGFRNDYDGTTTIIFSDGRTLKFNFLEALPLMRVIRVAARDHILRGGGSEHPTVKKFSMEKILWFLDNPVPEEERIDNFEYMAEEGEEDGRE